MSKPTPLLKSKSVLKRRNRRKIETKRKIYCAIRKKCSRLSISQLAGHFKDFPDVEIISIGTFDIRFICSVKKKGCIMERFSSSCQISPSIDRRQVDDLRA